MKSVIAIVGRPNVGKSTLFNSLTKSRNALVADRPGVTRDRQYGFGNYKGHEFILIDTGGLGRNDKDSENIANLISDQSLRAIEEADVLRGEEIESRMDRIVSVLTIVSVWISNSESIEKFERNSLREDCFSAFDCTSGVYK